MKSFMTQQTATSGMFWFRQGLRLVRGIAIATAVASSSAVSFAQDGGSSNPSSDPQLAAFAALPPAIRAALIREGRDVMRDAMTPGALRNYVQTCLRFGPFQACESMEGPSVSAGLMEGMSVTASRGDQGWSVGAGPEYSTPGIVGGTVGATRYFDSGNVEACAGPTIGLAPVASGSVQGCYVVDRKRAREMRDVIAWAEKIAALRAQSTLGDGGRPLDPSRQDLSQLYEEFVNLIRNDPNVYNNPFATGGGSTSFCGGAPKSAKLDAAGPQPAGKFNRERAWDDAEPVPSRSRSGNAAVSSGLCPHPARLLRRGSARCSARPPERVRDDSSFSTKMPRGIRPRHDVSRSMPRATATTPGATARTLPAISTTTRGIAGAARVPRTTPKGTGPTARALRTTFRATGPIPLVSPTTRSRRPRISNSSSTITPSRVRPQRTVRPFCRQATPTPISRTRLPARTPPATPDPHNPGRRTSPRFPRAHRQRVDRLRPRPGRIAIRLPSDC